MSTIYYSQVNKALQRELVARGVAGVSNRTTEAISYMVEKIANVEVSAYYSRPNKQSKPIPGFGTLGGSAVTVGSYMPSGPNGYLNDLVRPAHRIPPVVTAVSVAQNDQSKNYINKASITILIPDATTDINNMEAVWCKPGQYIKIKVVHPDSAILTKDGGILSPDGIPSEPLLKKLYPDTDLNSLRKLNEFYFQGRISTFSYSYNPDGSISLTVEAIGTSNTYVDVQLFTNSKKKSTTTTTETVNEVDSIYTSISADVDEIINSYNQKKINEFEHTIDITNADGSRVTDRSVLVGVPYKIGNTTSPETTRMITLGYLIDHMNTKIFAGIDAEIRINCDDKICFSNYYEKLISADPINILLWEGKSSVKSSTYTITPEQAQRLLNVSKPNDITMFPNIKPTSNGFSETSADLNKSYPSRIYINLDLIKKIVDELSKTNEPTIKKFLMRLSSEILAATGNAINLGLVQHPTIPEALLFYDTNFITTSALVEEFTIPIFATATGTSVVRDFTLTSKVPAAVQNMIFGIDSSKTSTQRQVAYNPYIYADEATKKKLAADFAKEHINALSDLAVKKYTFSQRPSDKQNIQNLQRAIEKYVTYFTPNIEESVGTNKSIFPMDLEFTIDGINGFKFGDVLNFAGLPKRYTDSFIFTIIGVSHNITTAGEWTTTIKCIPRIRIK
jgi:hypothetical protein